MQYTRRRLFFHSLQTWQPVREGVLCGLKLGKRPRRNKIQERNRVMYAFYLSKPCHWYQFIYQITGNCVHDQAVIDTAQINLKQQ